MSALGHKRTFAVQNGILQCNSVCPLCANSGHLVDYSITSSATASIPGGILRPSVFAAFRFMTSSNFVGCNTGRSAGLAPLSILPA